MISVSAPANHELSNLFDKVFPATPITEKLRLRVTGSKLTVNNGEPIRLFGTNLSYSAAFPDHETSEKLAKRLRRLGYNLVRIHNIDSDIAPRGIFENKDMKELNPKQLDRLGYLIAQLKKQGVYVALSIHTARNYHSLAKDTLHKFRYGKGLNIIMPSLIEQQKEYAMQLLTYTNPHTQLTYANDPAIAMIEINNENSLIPAIYNKNINQAPDEFKEMILKQWQLATKPEQNKKNIRITDLYKDPRFNSFIARLEAEYFLDMRSYLKKEIGSKSIIIGTQATYGDKYGLLRETKVSDVIDTHIYLDHPKFKDNDWSSSEWSIDNREIYRGRNLTPLLNGAIFRIKEKPFLVSELSSPAPNLYSGQNILFSIAFASLQDWNGIFHFDYASSESGLRESNKINGFFNSAGHPGNQIFGIASAIIFRKEIIPPHKDEITLSVTEQELQNTKNKTILSIWQAAGLDINAPLKAKISVHIKDSEKSLNPILKRTKNNKSNTRASWNGKQNTPKMHYERAFIAVITDKEITNPEIQIPKTMANEKEPITITIISLDNKKISHSKHLLIIAAGATQNSEMQWNQGKTSLKNGWGSSPVLISQPPTQIQISTIMKSAKINYLDANGVVQKTEKRKSARGNILLKIEKHDHTPWWEIQLE